MAQDPNARLYGREYYESEGSGVGRVVYERNAHWTGFFSGIAAEIDRRLRPTTALDVGCAIGMLVEALIERGVDARGFDLSEYAISQVPDAMADRVWVASTTDPIDGRFDLVVSIEVLEHLPSAEIGHAVANITAVTDTFLLSTTPEDFADPTHFNVRPPEYWAELLAAHDFYRDPDFDATFITPWAALYRRRTATTAEIVRDYERESWRLRTEARLLRDALNDANGGASADSLAHTVDELRHDLRMAIDAAQGAEAISGNAQAKLRDADYEINRLQNREYELGEMLRSSRAEMDALNESQLFRLFKVFLRVYSRLRG